LFASAINSLAKAKSDVELVARAQLSAPSTPRRTLAASLPHQSDGIEIDAGRGVPAMRPGFTHRLAWWSQ